MNKPVEFPLQQEPKEFKRPKPFYDQWQNDEGIPIHNCFHVPDLAKVELAPWKRYGGKAAFINMEDPHLTAAIVLELAPGETLKPMKHMFETWCYIVEGRGATAIQQKGHQDQTVKWRQHTLFAPPLNTTYTHRNVDTDKPARILMVHNAPLTMNLYHDEEFVFENDFVFKSRYRGEQGYFNPSPEIGRAHV